MQTNLIKAIVLGFGINSAILLTILGRGIQAIGGLVSIFFINLFLSQEEQGYYFTFVSILSLQIFFELGLSTIITQFAAHEVAFLNWTKNSFTGEQKHLSRLSSLLRLTIKWFSVAASVLFIMLIVAGFFFFKVNRSDTVFWQAPWILVAIATCSSTLVTAILAFYEGLQKVKEVALIRLCQQSAQIVILLISLLCGFKLFALGIALSTACIVGLGFVLFSPAWRRLKLIYSVKVAREGINWRREIFPYQWKIAVSWVSGFLIFQIFTPVLFAFQGAVVAGQMGLTVAVLQGLVSIANVWFRTKIPLFSILIAQRNFETLDNVFNKSFKQSIGVLILGILAFNTFYLICNHYNLSVIKRFLPFSPAIFLMMAILMQLISDGFSTYLRCHKKEPFLVLSFITAVVSAASIIITCKYFDVEVMTMGYFLILTIMTFFAFSIYRAKKVEWHSLSV